MREISPPRRNPPSTGIGAAGMRGRLIAGTGALFSSLIAYSILQILSVPIFLDFWGPEIYGDWLALNAGAGLLSLLDFGLSTHLVNRILALSARGDGRAVRDILATGSALFGVLMAAGAVLVAAAWLADLPSYAGIEAPGARVAAILQATAVLILLPRPLLGALFAARGRFAGSVYQSAALQLIPFAGVLAVVVGGGGLTAAASVNLVAVVASGWLLPLAVVRVSHPDIDLALRWPGWAELKADLRQSALFGLSSAASVATLQAPILALQMLSPNGIAVVAFTTMRTATGVLRQVTGQVVVSSALEMTRQYNQAERAGLERLFIITGRIAGGSIGLLAAPLLVLGPALFQQWTSNTIAFDLSLALTFVVTAVVVVPGTTGLTLLRQTGHAEMLAIVHLAQIAVGLTLCLVLVPHLASLGAALAVSAAELLVIGGLISRHAVRVFSLDARRVFATSWCAAAVGLAIGMAASLALVSALPTETLPEVAWLAAAWVVIVAPTVPFLLLPRGERRSLWLALGAVIPGRRPNARRGPG